MIKTQIEKLHIREAVVEKKMKPAIRPLCIFILFGVFISILLTPTQAFADKDDKKGKESTQRSIQHDWVSKTIDSGLSASGSLLPGLPTYEEKEKWAKETLLDPDGSPKHSLYERFGEAPYFQEYYGEVTIPILLQDNIYTSIIENSGIKISLEEIKKILTKSAVSNNEAYRGRPEVMTSLAYENGYYDPRVERYSPIQFSAGATNYYKINMWFDKIFTEITGFFISPSVLNVIHDMWGKAIDSGLWDTISELGKMLLFLGLIIFIASITALGINFYRGRGGVREVSERVGVLFVSLIFFAMVVATPKPIGEVFYNFAGKLDETSQAIINKAISSANQSDDVRNAAVSAIWEKSVLDPICFGHLGTEYRNSYTMFSGEDGIPESQQFKQTADNISKGTDDKPALNSKDSIGDAFVPLGGGKYERNWCALIISTQSKFHLPSDKKSMEELKTSMVGKTNDKIVWPVAFTLPRNSQLYGDSFKWVDAVMDIGTHYTKEGKLKSYDRSKSYTNYFGEASIMAMVRYIALIPLLILGIKKTIASISIVIAGAKLFYYSVMSLLNKGFADWIENLKKIGLPLYHYLWYTFVITLGVIAYSKTMENGFAGLIVWLIASYVMIKVQPITDLQKTGRSIKRTINQTRFRR